MIKVEKHRIFSKYYRALSAKQISLFAERIALFIKNPRHPLLRVHYLKGPLRGQYAFSLGGDLRVVFFWPTKDKIILYKIGTHNQVY